MTADFAMANNLPESPTMLEELKGQIDELKGQTSKDAKFFGLIAKIFRGINSGRLTQDDFQFLVARLMDTLKTALSFGNGMLIRYFGCHTKP